MSSIVLKNYETYSKLKDAYTEIEQSIDRKTFENFKQMLRLITHRLNNSVGSIRFDAINLLEKTDLYPELEEEFLDIKNAALEALSIPEELGEFVRKLQNKKSFVDLNSIINDVIQIGYRNNINFNLISLDLLPAVQANYGLLHEVFKEIFTNAVRAMPQGGTVTVTGNIVNNEKVRIDIQDEGIGIPKNKISSIFQHGISMWPDRKGTGGGLFLIKKVVESDHGGQVLIESQEGAGSTFSVILSIQN